MKLDIKIVERNDDVELYLGGILDERCELPEFEDPIKGRLRINLEHLSMMNSLGCRKWILWIRGIRAGKGITLERCSPVAVNQMNILAGFLHESISVVSLFVPYYCETCSKDQLELFEPDAKNHKKQVEMWPDQVTCKHCKAMADLDVLKPSYFKFFERKTA